MPLQLYMVRYRWPADHRLASAYVCQYCRHFHDQGYGESEFLL